VDLQAAGQDAEAAHRAAQLGLQRSELGLKRQSIDQDAWGFGQDATGGGVLYNKKTGQTIPVSPRGAFAGAGSGLKPQQFESDIQALGEDMEEAGKMSPDLKTLEGAADLPDQPGFGPVAGSVPNWIATEEGIGLRQAAGRLMVNLLAMTSGKTVSDAEAERQLKARGLGLDATPDAFRQGVRALSKELDDVIQLRRAKYHPTVVDTYDKRGGFTARPPGAAGPVKVTTIEEARALPPGTRFIDPQGTERVR
jgi:hypothetical protein